MWFGFVYKLGVLLYIYFIYLNLVKNKFLRVYEKNLLRLWGLFGKCFI